MDKGLKNVLLLFVALTTMLSSYRLYKYFSLSKNIITTLEGNEIFIQLTSSKNVNHGVIFKTNSSYGTIFDGDFMNKNIFDFKYTPHDETQIRVVFSKNKINDNEVDKSIKYRLFVIQHGKIIRDDSIDYTGATIQVYPNAIKNVAPQDKSVDI